MPTTRKEQYDEILKCGEDPVHFIKTYLYIQHPTKGRLPFKLYQFQEDCLQDFLTYKYNIVLKTRQLGLSTTTAAYCLWMAMFRRDVDILIMATKLEVGKNMISKIRTAFKMLPGWMLSMLNLTEPEAESVKYIKFTNGSKITAIPTSEDAGRSSALSLLVIDEAAHIDNLSELWKGLWSTLSTGGRCIMFSTPNGKNFFHHMWSNADTGVYKEGLSGEHCTGVGRNGFHGIRLPWTVHPERNEQWFDEQAAALDTRGIAQELLGKFEGSSMTFFPQASIEFLKEMVKEPLVITGPSNRNGTTKETYVWAEPVLGHKYVVAADVSLGVSYDYSTFYVFDTMEHEVVAEYMGKIPPDKFGEYLVEVATKYNQALIVNERNNVGIGTAIKLRDTGYPNVYYDEADTERMQLMTPEECHDVLPGWTTTVKNRNKILENLEQVIRNKQIRIYSTRFIEQMDTFIWNGKRGQALKNKNDDLVMAMAIGLQMFSPAAQTLGYIGTKETNKVVTAGILSGMSRGSTKPTNTNPQTANQKPKVNPWVQPETVRTIKMFRSEFDWFFKYQE